MDANTFSEVMNHEYPNVFPITQKTISVTLQESQRYRGSVRLALGYIWTDEEYNKFRQEVESKPLP